MFQNISTDTRTIKPGDLFIPLKGANFDGRKFIKEAIRKGATVLDVKDGLKAYHKIAADHRHKFDIPVIGVTGSSGKTTVKDMIASILSQKYKTLKNEENYNNEIGVPKTLLQLNKSHHAAVIEMAMQGLGEIDEIAKIASPTIAVITNIGETHLKQLKTKKNIARAKAEIIDHVRRGGYIILNADDEYYKYLAGYARRRGLKIISFGMTSAGMSKNAKLLKSLKLPGKHNIYNALAAIAVARILKIPDIKIAAGLKKVKTSKHRMKIIKKRGVTIIDDTYNANPSSMKAALGMLGSINGRRIAVLGDMLELGPRTIKYHKEIGEFAVAQGVDILIGVGKLAKHYVVAAKKRGATTLYAKTTSDAAGKLNKLINSGDKILIKGSRGMKLEKIVEKLQNA